MDNIQETYKDEHGVAMVPLAYHETSILREKKEKKWIIIGFLLAMVAIVGLFVFLWLQYDYVTDIDASGVYVLTDANGNVIASDLAPEDVIQIMEGLINGENPNQEK